jgi:hypothetical protein
VRDSKLERGTGPDVSVRRMEPDEVGTFQRTKVVQLDITWLALNLVLCENKAIDLRDEVHAEGRDEAASSGLQRLAVASQVVMGTPE